MALVMFVQNAIANCVIESSSMATAHKIPLLGKCFVSCDSLAVSENTMRQCRRYATTKPQLDVIGVFFFCLTTTHDKREISFACALAFCASTLTAIIRLKSRWHVEATKANIH